MDWIFYILGSAVLISASSIVQKKALLKEHAMEFAAVFALFNLFLSFLFINKVDFDIEPRFFLIIFVAGTLGAAAFLFLAKAIRHLPISSVYPLLNFGPALSALLAFIFLGEKITLLQLGGIILLIIGAYALEVDHSLSNLKKPLIRFLKSRYMHFIFLALLLYGITSVIDRYVLTNGVSIFTYIFLAHVTIAIVMLLFIIVYHDGFKGVVNGVKRYGKWIFIVSVFMTSHRLLQAQAISLAPVSIVLAVKRMSTLVTTAVGGKLFHESGLKIKIIACCIMIGGVLLVII